MSRFRIGGQIVEVEPNLADRVVGYLDPVRGARRLHARVRTAMVESYVGASRRRRSMSEWPASVGDADADTLVDIDVLRARSRDLIRNQPLATGAINTKVTSIVGTGLRLNARINAQTLGIDDATAQKMEAALQAEWELFSESTECDIARTSTFAEIQELALRSMFENGDTLVLLPFLDRAPFPYSLKLQLVEADRVCNPDWRTDTALLAGGVEKDATGAPITYHIAKTHPGQRFKSGMQWDAVLAYGAESGRRNVLHLYRKLRIGQTRGVPDLAPVIEHLKLISRYTEAELMATVVAAMFTVFVKTETGEGLGPMTPLAETGAKPDDDTVRMGHAAIVDLAANEDVVIANPSRPNAAFDPFVMAILRQVGVALELPYEILIKHFTASYSASRAAMVEAWKFFRARRQWLGQSLCQPVYEALVTEAVLRGRVSLPGFIGGDETIRRAYLGAMWVGPAKGQIDEKAEVEAAINRMDSGLTTLEYETAEMTGGDWELNTAQRMRERAALDAAGLLPAPPPAPGEGGQDPNGGARNDERARRGKDDESTDAE